MALRDIATKDIGWKIFSVVLALIIWLTIRTISSEAPADHNNPLATWVTRSITNLPVLVVSAAADVREFKVNPKSVDIRVSARPEIMAALLDSEIHATVDLTDIQSAQGLRKRVDISSPPGVTVVSVTPLDVDIVIPPKRNGTTK